MTARTSAFAFRGKEMKIAEIARELGVAHILEGTVRKAGNRIRVTAQLIKAADGFHVWSERYDCELNDVFAIQDEMAAAIVTQLKVNLTGVSAPAHAARPTNLGSYEAVLEGRHNWYRWTPSSIARSLTCFERATSIDPSYAPGHSGAGRSKGGSRQGPGRGTPSAGIGSAPARGARRARPGQRVA